VVERVHEEINCRTRVAGLFPNEASLLCLVNAVLMELSEEWETVLAEQRNPTICNFSDKMEGKDDMIKSTISLQDLRRGIYIKAKAEPAWRSW